MTIRRRIGSDEARTWARKLSLNNALAKGLMQFVCNYVGDEGIATASLETLSEDSEQSVATVRRRLRWLEEMGVVTLLPRWVDADGRINYEGRGRQVCSDIRLNLDIDLVDLAMRTGGASPSADDEHGAPEAGDSCQQPLNPGAGGGWQQPRGISVGVPVESPPIGSEESSLKKESTPKSPSLPEASSAPQQAPAPAEKPQAGIQGEQAADPEFEADWQSFVNGWPGPILDPPKAQAELRKLSVTDRRACIGKLPDYGAYCRRVRNDPMKAHLFVKKRSWEGLGHKASSDPDITGFVRASSAEGAAVRVIWGLAGMSPREIEHAGERGYWCGFRMTDQLRALALAPFPRGIAPPPTTWPEFEEGSANHLRWREITKATIQRSVLVMRGKIRAPWPWPPRVDGTLSSAPEPSSTGPPPELSPAEQEEFTGSM